MGDKIMGYDKAHTKEKAGKQRGQFCGILMSRNCLGELPSSPDALILTLGNVKI